MTYTCDHAGWLCFLFLRKQDCHSSSNTRVPSISNNLMLLIDVSLYPSIYPSMLTRRNQYLFGRLLGEGRMGEVRHAIRRSDGESVAVKCVKRHRHSQKEVSSDCAATFHLCSLFHGFGVSVYCMTQYALENSLHSSGPVPQRGCLGAVVFLVFCA